MRLASNGHTAQRGPFVFEHEATSRKDVKSCHEPHGSVNDKMLDVRGNQILWLEEEKALVLGRQSELPPPAACC